MSVRDEIELLMAAGVPQGAVRETPRALPDPEALREAMFAVASELDDGELTPYVAWLAAWEHHWPASFAEVFGERGAALLARLRPRVPDGNRYLKLRRIAIENLARVL